MIARLLEKDKSGRQQGSHPGEDVFFRMECTEADLVDTQKGYRV